MQRIDSEADILRGLDALTAIDTRLQRVRAVAGMVPLRRSPAGFHSLASVIVSQQVSRASAEAIFARLCRAVVPLTPRRLIAADEGALTDAGLSRAKQQTLLALAEKVASGALDLEQLGGMPAEEARAAMILVPGIGPWTAEVYLLISAGHADIFPAGDVALQGAVADALALERRPNGRALAKMAESWAPWRSVAARLFWAYWREMRGREAAPAA